MLSVSLRHINRPFHRDPNKVAASSYMHQSVIKRKLGLRNISLADPTTVLNPKLIAFRNKPDWRRYRRLMKNIFIFIQPIQLFDLTVIYGPVLGFGSKVEVGLLLGP